MLEEEGAGGGRGNEVCCAPFIHVDSDVRRKYYRVPEAKRGHDRVWGQREGQGISESVERLRAHRASPSRAKNPLLRPQPSIRCQEGIPLDCTFLWVCYESPGDRGAMKAVYIHPTGWLSLVGRFQMLGSRPSS